MYLWEKEYIFEKDSEIVAQDCHTFLMLHGKSLTKMMHEAGLELQGATPDNGYIVYQKGVN